jgi:CelD/BcsL family acetyltransferase involved in cellulose biosynthesis
LQIPESYDAFLQSRSANTRQSVRRYGRKLEKEHPGKVSLAIYRNESELEQFFAAAAEIGRKTYQHGLGVTLAGDGVARRLTELQARRGWFRGYVLSIDGSPAAFWHGHHYRGVFATGVPGYDPAYAHLRLGTHVLMKLIEDLTEEGTAKVLDFGSGDAEYKRRFSDDSWDEEDVLVWASTAKGIRTNLTRTGVLALIGGAKRVASSKRLGDALKSRWRKRLRSDTT